MAKRREERETGMFLDGIIESMPLIVKELVAGGVAGGVAKTFVAPLERVKILFQVTGLNFFFRVELKFSFFRFVLYTDCCFSYWV